MTSISITLMATLSYLQPLSALMYELYRLEHHLSVPHESLSNLSLKSRGLTIPSIKNLIRMSPNGIMIVVIIWKLGLSMVGIPNPIKIYDTCSQHINDLQSSSIWCLYYLGSKQWKICLHMTSLITMETNPKLMCTILHLFSLIYALEIPEP